NCTDVMQPKNDTPCLCAQPRGIEASSDRQEESPLETDAVWSHADADTAAAREDIIGEVIAEGLSFSHARRKVLEAFERRFIEAALPKSGGNVTRAAAVSGLARRYFYKVRARFS